MERERSESHEPGGGIQVRDGVFEPMREGIGKVRIIVLGRNLWTRGSPLLARVGDQLVRSIRTAPGGRGFTGILPSQPRAGDRLYVRYAGSREVPTNVVYRAPSGPPLVA
jgi:hypothetical protein